MVEHLLISVYKIKSVITETYKTIITQKLKESFLMQVLKETCFCDFSQTFFIKMRTNGYV